MIPYLLAAVGGYLLGDSMKKSEKFANGGMAGGEKRSYGSYYGHTIMNIMKINSVSNVSYGINSYSGSSRVFVNKIPNEVDGTPAKKEDYIEITDWCIENSKKPEDYIDNILLKKSWAKVQY